MEPSNRNLFRPSLTDVKEPKEAASGKPAEEADASRSDERRELLLHQADAVEDTDGDRAAKTARPFTALSSGTTRRVLKVNREEGPNLLVYKSNIKYMYKALRGRLGRP